MFNLYLSNHLENLTAMLNQVLKHTEDSPLAKHYVLVQHRGMQHWLLMQLANHSQIAMNIQFEPPGTAIWSILRELDDTLPKESPYRINTLTWRVYQLLADERVVNDEAFTEANQFWQSSSNKPKNQGKQQQLRYQLARNLADLFEQYQIYRPDWIMQWTDGQTPNWQAKLWHYLTEQEPRHPVGEMLRLLAEFKDKPEFKPKQRVLFGFNSLPPLWLKFFQTLAERQDMHLFLLNPSDEFWGDVQSEKQIARQRVKWLDGGQALETQISHLGNPLLASMGEQGQEFLKLLYDNPQPEVAVFSASSGDTLLQQVQNDVLRVQDKRDMPERTQDDSIVIANCHSPLREVQKLHDWLLSQFEQNSQLVPSDVLVMCPAVESYAPYIEAVFSSYRTVNAEQTHRLPCSIADRRFSSNMPLVQLFSELLELPDARFNVSQILQTMRSPYVQRRFGWNEADLQTISNWLEQAAIHWGKDAQHKANLGLPARNSFSWQQGLSRLLLGFAYGDQTQLYGEDNPSLLLPDVEGENSVLLGKLILFIESLQSAAQSLNRARSVEDWKDQLLQMVDQLFELDDQPTLEHRVITNAIAELHQFANAAGCVEQLTLSVVKAYFETAFNQPQQSQHFMTGQVTFCSMIPMRSIPFKIICILGMNDGDFPRIKESNTLDLLAQDGHQPGDRSRRGDDRYLFLESLISARDKLYISYQGHAVKDNGERQPSTVLLELLDYLQAGYGWTTQDILHAPLQPFSAKNYQGQHASFDAGWLQLAQKPSADRLLPNLKLALEDKLHLTVEDVVAHFDNPARSFAQNQLALKLTDYEVQLSDTEPFATNHLDRYLVQQVLLDSLIKGEEIEPVLQQVQLSGQLPDTDKTPQELEDWQQVANEFADNLIAHGAQHVEKYNATYMTDDIALSSQLPVQSDSQDLMFWRLADAKGKDHVRLWLHHLIANIDKPTTTKGFYRDSKKQQGKQLTFSPTDNAQVLLNDWLHAWQQGQQQVQYANAELGLKLFEKDRKGQLKPFEQGQFDAFWRDTFNQRGPGFDPYNQYFWPDTPAFSQDDKQAIVSLFEPLLQHRTIES